jgi:hypothetical protein
VTSSTKTVKLCSLLAVTILLWKKSIFPLLAAGAAADDDALTLLHGATAAGGDAAAAGAPTLSLCFVKFVLSCVRLAGETAGE